MSKLFQRKIRVLFFCVSYYFAVINLNVVSTLLSNVEVNFNSNSENCFDNDFEYHYTQCNSKSERWRFAVPKTFKTKCKNVPPPLSLNCSFSCTAGNFLDLTTHSCQQCQPGTYSLGDGFRYEELTEMPNGFTVENFPDHSDQFVFDQYTAPKTSIECSDQIGWVIQNKELRYLPTPCISKMSISLNLIHNGYIQFYYKTPKNSQSLFSILQVRNAFCQSYGDPRSMLFQSLHQPIPLLSSNPFDSRDGVMVDESAVFSSLPNKRENELRLHRLHLRSGQNLITWTVANNLYRTTLADIIYVPKIDIFGVAFTPVCMPCPAGTYSQKGAQKCKICPAGTFSHKGFSVCKKCSSLEYSGPKSDKCLKRPECQSFDFYLQREAHCVKNNTKQLSQTANIKPNICLKTFQTAKINVQPIEESCQRCRPGMARKQNTRLCEYCKTNEYSLDGLECKKCSNNTIPDFGLYFTQWDVLPQEIKTTCEYLFAEQETCDFLPTWILYGNRIESARTRARGVVLGISVEVASGFYNPLRMGGMNSSATLDNPISKVSIEIELSCEERNCQLYFVQERINSSLSNRYNIIASFNGTQKRSIFTFSIMESQPTRFVLAFMRSGVELGKDSLNDYTILYSLNITNVGNLTQKKFFGGGRTCIQCPSKDPHTNECISCLPGHYFDDIKKCVKCPFGTALKLNSSLKGIDSCEKCGGNLGSVDGIKCSFLGRFKLPSSLEDYGTNKIIEFDVTQLKNRFLMAKGIHVFAREGNSYFHSFNISIFGESVQCRNTINSMSTIDKALSAAEFLDSSYISFDSNDALFCRSTAVPSETLLISSNNNNITNSTMSIPRSNIFNGVFFASSTVISRRIAEVSQNRKFGSFYLSNDQLEYDSSLPSTIRPVDVHIFYEPLPPRLPTCPYGVLGVVTLRCKLTAVEEPIVRLSQKCPDGTCDGCLYHIIIESSSACPICHSNDFQEIRGECIDNLQKFHYIPSKHCVFTGAQKHEKTKACSNLSKKVFLLLLFAAILITCLMIMILIIYEKNKRLEYRYIKIVEGKEHDNDPATNSCALKSEDENDIMDDEDSSNVKELWHTFMDFEALLAQAGSNARKLNKKVREADLEMEFEKRRNMERLTLQKKTEKEDFKKKVTPRLLSPDKPRFVIPKKKSNIDVDKDKITKFLHQKEFEKQKNLAKERSDKEQLIKLRLEANGGRANKKISKHFGKSQIELQMQYAHNPQHEKVLRRQQKREEEEHERLSATYRTGVHKAINKKDDVISQKLKGKNSLADLYKTRNFETPLKQLSSTNGSSSKKPAHQPEIWKRKASTEMTNFLSLMKRAEANNGLNYEKVTFDSEFRCHAEKQSLSSLDQSKESNYAPRKLAPVLKARFDKSHQAKETHFSAASKLSNPAKISFEKPSKKQCKVPKITVTAEKEKIKTMVDAESELKREKRYLPGDIRYKASTSNGAILKNGEQKEKQMSPVNKRYNSSATASKMSANNFIPQRMLSSTKYKLSCDDRLLNFSTSKQSTSTSKGFSACKSETNNMANALSELERRKRELKELEKEIEKKQLLEEKRKNEISLEKIKNEQRMRAEINQRYNANRSVKKPQLTQYTNYSDTDEEDENVDDEEYDSDMADFIDDTVVDDLQREDFEESLRMINPRYDKKKWKMREQMIDDRRMDARFRDIEVEERQSAKYGFYEDIMEARRGSKALG